MTESWLPLPKQYILMTSPARENFYAGAAGPGKAQPLNASIYTPYGPKPMGEIKVGDQLCSPDGGVTHVIAVHPQGDQDIYKVTTSDGGITRVTEDHLWLVHTAGKKTKREYRQRIQTTRLLIDQLERQPQNTRSYRPILPLTAPVLFNRPARTRYGPTRPVDGYLLGLLIGDGSLNRTTPILTTYDAEIMETAIAIYPDAHQLTDVTISFPGLYPSMRKLKLVNRSEDKHIPDSYKYSTVPERWKLIQGLMDTDGTVDSKGYVTFTSVSKQLATDVQWLVRSLGFKATITERQPFYTDGDGERVNGQMAFNVYISGDNESDLFRLKRKGVRTRKHFNGGVSEWGRRINSIEYEGRAQAQCITVDHPNGLYLTDDFIVTHNSDTFIQIGKRSALQIPRSRQVYFRRVSKDLDSHVDEAKSYIPVDGPDRVARFNSDKNLKKFTFPNGAVFDFTHLQHEAHKENHRGPSYDRIYFDEASTFTQEQIAFLSTRLRSTRPETKKLGGPKLYLASNPLGESHHYLLNNYIEPDVDYVKEVLGYYPIDHALDIWERLKREFNVTPGGDHEPIREACKAWIREVREKEVTWTAYDEETRKRKKVVDPFDVWVAYPNELMLEHGIESTHPRVFIPAYLSDNPYLGEDYVTQLASNYNQDVARAMLEGDWSVFEGQFFSEFRPQRVIDGVLTDWHVIPPQTPEPWQLKICAMDWGFSDRSMAVIGWFYYDEMRAEWIMWEELAQNRLTDTELIRRWKAQTGNYPIDFVSADASMFYDRSADSGKSRGEFWMDSGVPMVPANRDRVQGWAALRELFGVNPRTGRPKLRICSNCRYTIKSLPGLVYAENKAEDLNTNGNDHGADMLRYFAVRALGMGQGGSVPADYTVGVGSYDALAVEEGPQWQEIPNFLIGDEPDPYRS